MLTGKLNKIQSHIVLTLTVLLSFCSGLRAAPDRKALARTYIPKFEKILEENIASFWYAKSLDRQHGGYTINFGPDGTLKGEGTKMIVSQARTVWLFSRLARAGYKKDQYLEAADHGYRFLREKMWDSENGGFYWEVDVTGDTKLRPRKHLYGQAFGLYAVSEFYLASGREDVLEFAVRFFNLLEAKSHDKTYGGYVEFFNENWTPVPEGESSYMGGGPNLKLMNTHLHLLEAMTTFYRASKLPLARERLLELINIQSNAVVRKDIGACTDKYSRDWTPRLEGDYARVSYGHDIENVWLLMDACDAAGVSNYPFVDLYRTLFDYSLKYGYDEASGGFYDSGHFNQPADRRNKVWWVQTEAIVSALYMNRMTQEPKYLDVFEKTGEFIEKNMVDWKTGEWHGTVTPDGKQLGDKASPWKAGYHNGRSMIECLQILRQWKVHQSSDFGWIENQDITKEFAVLLERGKLKAGEELVLDHKYRISGSYELPDDFTLSAVKGGGFDVTDAVKPENNRPLLELGNNNTLRNLTITYLNAPKPGPTGEKREVNFTPRLGIQARGRHDLLIENCRLVGSIGHHLKLSDCRETKVIGCHIAGGHWSVYLVGNVTDAVFRHCLIEKCQGDGIKTGGSSGVVRRVLVEECVFQDNLRDGIDTTGGFNDSVVRNTIFRRLGVSGMDIKSHYESKTGRIEELSPENTGILVENCLFHDMPNAIVLSTLDCGRRRGPGNELLNAENIKTYAPHDIDINNCVIGHAEKPLQASHEGGYGVNYPSEDGEHTRMILLKDAYSIRYRNARLSGDRIKPVQISSIGGSRHLSKEAAQALERTVTGNVVDEPAPPIKPGMKEVSFDCGPQALE